MKPRCFSTVHEEESVGRSQFTKPFLGRCNATCATYDVADGGASRVELSVSTSGSPFLLAHAPLYSLLSLSLSRRSVFSSVPSCTGVWALRHLFFLGSSATLSLFCLFSSSGLSLKAPHDRALNTRGFPRLLTTRPPFPGPWTPTAPPVASADAKREHAAVCHSLRVVSALAGAATGRLPSSGLSWNAMPLARVLRPAIMASAASQAMDGACHSHHEAAEAPAKISCRAGDRPSGCGGLWPPHTGCLGKYGEQRQ